MPATAAWGRWKMAIRSDGFWHGISPQQMQQALHLVNTSQEWLTMMHQALKNGGADGEQDNYSAMAVWVGSPQDTTLLYSLSEATQFIPLRDENIIKGRL